MYIYLSNVTNQVVISITSVYILQHNVRLLTDVVNIYSGSIIKYPQSFPAHIKLVKYIPICLSRCYPIFRPHYQTFIDFPASLSNCYWSSGVSYQDVVNYPASVSRCYQISGIYIKLLSSIRLLSLNCHQVSGISTKMLSNHYHISGIFLSDLLWSFPAPLKHNFSKF